MSDDFDELERIADMRRVSNRTHPWHRKNRNAYARQVAVGVARSHDNWHRWAQRVSTAPITLPKIKALETE